MKHESWFIIGIVLLSICTLMPFSIASELIYSTFLGGNWIDQGKSIAVDTAGNVYITGNTNSPDFPITVGAFDTTISNDFDVFITKINPSGSILIYSTILGGTGGEGSWVNDDAPDYGLGIAVDKLGNAYVCGATQSPDFPITTNAYQSWHNGPMAGTSMWQIWWFDGFFSKLNADGSQLLYSTFLGGGNEQDYQYYWGDDYCAAIAVDTEGNAYIAGWTNADNFPTTPGSSHPSKTILPYPLQIYNIYNDGFVCKINPTLSGSSSLIYSTYDGVTAGEMQNHAIAIDSVGNTYITGMASGIIPTTSAALDTTKNGGNDAFILKFNATGSSLLYGTYLGGSGNDSGNGITLDNSGNIYITGYTGAASFPITSGAYDTTYNNNTDIFVSKLNTSGTTLLYSTFLGGSGTDIAQSLSIDTIGNIYIAGYTSSSTDFPTTSGAIGTTYGGNTDGFICKLNAAGTGLIYSTFIGGNSDDYCNSIVTDSTMSFYITGYTNSSNFPITAGAYDTTYNSNIDVFVMKFEPVIADFYGTPTLGSSPLPVQFYNTSYGVPTSWSWSFGDGYFSSLQNPANMYTTTGMYTVTLVVSNALGTSTATKNNYIVVNSVPIANFYGSPTTGYPPLSVQFTDTSYGYPTSWSWTFGDGSTSILQNPMHNYLTVGDYTVRLIVRNAFGTATVTKNRYIIVGPEPLANFYGSPTTGASPSSVQFYDTSAGGIISWFWSFGDVSTSTIQNPVHVYQNAGNYSVSLIVSNLYGSNTVLKTNYIHAYTIPTADFYGTPTSGIVPLSVAFYDTSLGNITDWQWSFGDGSTSTIQNPSHSYATAGNYTVRLIVSNPLGVSTTDKTNYIQVYSVPTAGFYGTPTSGLAPLAVQFYDTSFGNATSWSWMFGDESTSSIQNPTHTYYAPGNYTVTLMIRNPLGTNTTIKNNYIHAYSIPTANFYGTPTSGASPLVVQFYDTSAGNPASWLWTFGDGSTSSSQNPVHTFTTVSAITSYNVRLGVSNSYGTNTITKNSYIRITPPVPTPDFYGIPTSGIAPLFVQFTDSSLGNPTSWSWTFGDGYGSGLQNPANTYFTPGNFTVTLIADNAYGSGTTIKTNYIQVYAGLTAVFYGTPTTGPAPLSVQFYDISYGNPTDWLWSFGDGTTSITQNPLHTYTHTGTYTVTLSVNNPYGTDTVTKPGYILIPTGLDKQFWMLYK
jgi:PKD repeat protein